MIAPVTLADPVKRLVKTTSASFEVPVPTTPPFVRMPFTLSSVELFPLTRRIFAAGTAVPSSVTKLVGTVGGTGPAAELI